MSDDFSLSQLNSGNATRAIVDANNARQETDEQRRRAILAEAALANVTTDRDLERKTKQLVNQVRILTASNEYAKQQLAASEATLMEWMHSTEAFRRLARQYGKKLGVTDGERAADYASQVVTVAEEDPKFAATNVANEARKDQANNAGT